MRGRHEAVDVVEPVAGDRHQDGDGAEQQGHRQEDEDDVPGRSADAGHGERQERHVQGGHGDAGRDHEPDLSAC